MATADRLETMYRPTLSSPPRMEPSPPTHRWNPSPAVPRLLERVPAPLVPPAISPGGLEQKESEIHEVAAWLQDPDASDGSMEEEEPWAAAAAAWTTAAAASTAAATSHVHDARIGAMDIDVASHAVPSAPPMEDEEFDLVEAAIAASLVSDARSSPADRAVPSAPPMEDEEFDSVEAAIAASLVSDARSSPADHAAVPRPSTATDDEEHEDSSCRLKDAILANDTETIGMLLKSGARVDVFCDGWYIILYAFMPSVSVDTLRLLLTQPCGFDKLQARSKSETGHSHELVFFVPFRWNQVVRDDLFRAKYVAVIEAVPECVNLLSMEKLPILEYIRLSDGDTKLMELFLRHGLTYSLPDLALDPILVGKQAQPVLKAIHLAANYMNAAKYILPSEQELGYGRANCTWEEYDRGIILHVDTSYSEFTATPTYFFTLLRPYVLPYNLEGTNIIIEATPVSFTVFLSSPGYNSSQLHQQAISHCWQLNWVGIKGTPGHVGSIPLANITASSGTGRYFIDLSAHEVANNPFFLVSLAAPNLTSEIVHITGMAKQDHSLLRVDMTNLDAIDFASSPWHLSWFTFDPSIENNTLPSWILPKRFTSSHWSPASSDFSLGPQSFLEPNSLCVDPIVVGLAYANVPQGGLNVYAECKLSTLARHITVLTPCLP